jgi:tetratricopeptide (TPR) repeat protein
MLGRAVIILLLSSASWATAQEAGAHLYNQANRLYAEERFQEALESYQQVAATGVEDANLFYNLGNASFKSDHLGRAILWYERARRLDPRDPDIRNNLRFANAVKQDRDPVPDNIVWSAVVGTFQYPTLNELCVALSVFFVSMFVLAVVRLRAQGRATAGWVAAFAIVVALTVMDASWLGGRLYQRATAQEAIVIAAEVAARSGPDERQTSVFVIHEGTKVRIERHRAEWVLVRLANGLGGWLPGQVFEQI